MRLNSLVVNAIKGKKNKESLTETILHNLHVSIRSVKADQDAVSIIVAAGIISISPGKCL